MAKSRQKRRSGRKYVGNFVLSRSGRCYDRRTGKPASLSNCGEGVGGKKKAPTSRHKVSSPKRKAVAARRVRDERGRFVGGRSAAAVSRGTTSPLDKIRKAMSLRTPDEKLSEEIEAAYAAKMDPHGVQFMRELERTARRKQGIPASGYRVRRISDSQVQCWKIRDYQWYQAARKQHCKDVPGYALLNGIEQTTAKSDLQQVAVLSGPSIKNAPMGFTRQDFEAAVEAAVDKRISSGSRSRRAARQRFVGQGDDKPEKRGQRSDKGQTRHCVKVGKATTTDSCVCRDWQKGPAPKGQTFPEKCRDAGLLVAMAEYFGKGRKKRLQRLRPAQPPAPTFDDDDAFFSGAQFSGDFLASAADREFLADASPSMDGLVVPKTCKKYQHESARSFGMNFNNDASDPPVKVCVEFGAEKMATCGSVPKNSEFNGLSGSPSDGDLSGPLAKYYGLALVGGNDFDLGLATRYAVATLAAGLAGGLITSRTRVLDFAGGYAGYVAAAAAAAAAHFGSKRFLPQYRAVADWTGYAMAGVVTFALTSLAVKWIAPARSSLPSTGVTGLNAITSEYLDGFGNIVSSPESEFGDVDVLEGGYDDVDVLSDVDVLAGNGDVSVLAGAFGSLPFAGAV